MGLKSVYFRLFHLLLGLLIPCYKGKSRYKEVYNLRHETNELAAKGSRGLVIVSDMLWCKSWLRKRVVLANFLLNLLQCVFSPL